MLRDPDKTIRDAKAAEPDKPIRMRLQPYVFNRGYGGRRGAAGGGFVGWKGVHWNVQCDTVEEAIGIREALECFFRALSGAGDRAVRQALDSLVTDVPESAPLHDDTQ